VQNYLTQKAATYLSKQLNTKVSVGKVGITFFLNIVLEELNIQDLKQNNILDINKLEINLKQISFREKFITIDYIHLFDTDIGLIKYVGETDFNFQFIVDYFSAEEKDEKSDSDWRFSILGLKLSNINFVLQDNNEQFITRGIDFNNLGISSLNADIQNISISNDTINAYIKNLSCEDRSGFKLNNLSAFVSVSTSFLNIERAFLKTENSDINLDLRFDYDTYSAYNFFVDSVNMDIVLKKSKLHIEDIAYFAPNLFGMNNSISIDGQFRGKVSNLRGRNVDIKFGKFTHFNGGFTSMGLPDIDNTFINFNANILTTTISELNTFKLPSKDASSTLNIPAELYKLGFVTFTGNYTGFINDFVANGSFKTNLGLIKSDISLKTNKNNTLLYNGYLAVNQFNLGAILDMQAQLGKISFDFMIKGEGIDLDNADVTLNGKISSLEYNNYAYKNIDISGDLFKKRFEGYIEISESNIDLDFQGIIDLSKEKPVFDFSADLNYIKLDKLNIVASDVPIEFSAYFKCRFSGNDIENIGGIFILSNIIYSEGNNLLHIDQLHITNTANTNNYKRVALNSSIFDGYLDGFFNYKDLPYAFEEFIRSYLPSFSKETNNIEKSNTTRFNFDFNVRNANSLTDFFMPSLHLSDDFYIKGQFDCSDKSFGLEAAAKSIFVNNIHIKNWQLKSYPENNILKLRTNAKQIVFNKNMLIDDLVIKSQSKEDSILFDINWYNKSLNIRNSGDIAGQISFVKSPIIELNFKKSHVYINDSLWVLNTKNKIVFDSNAIAFTNMLFKHNNQMVMIDGVLSDDPDNQIDILFDKFDISDFNPLIKNQGVILDGILSGKISLFDVYNSFGFISDISINQIEINNDRLGNLILKTSWDKLNNRINIASDIIYVGSVGENTPFKASGYYYPSPDKNYFDITAELENFRLKLLEKYVSSFSSDFRGFATGTLHLKGTPDQPELTGKLNLRRAGIKVDFLNTTYNFSDEVIINKDAIIFENVVLNDVHGGKAILDGRITHDNFKNFALNLGFKLQNLLCLNTNVSQNDLFYGTAFASGNLHIHGPVEKINIDINAKTERNTRFFLPLEGPSEITENKFISFIVKDTISIKDESILADSDFDMNLNFELEVTPDAEVQIIFDSQIGDIIRARGSGNLKMEINMLGDFNMFGEYIIEDGDYLFTLQNIINKRFRINKGSQINWSGDPFNALTDIKAVYQVRTPLYDLFISTADSSSEYKKRVPVNCLLGMSGSLFNPDISFDIELPASDENTKNLLRSTINSEAEMNRQMFALLALNRFLPPAGLNEFSNVGIATGLEATSTELLSNQLSNWLSQISNDFDIGVNYRAGDELTSDEVEVALSTQLFNDRVIIDGSVGTSAGNQKTSQIVGDVNVEVKLTDDGKLRMKFYNKSNTFDILKNNAPYTQGIGVFYRREFDKFYELYKKKTKK